MIKEDHSMTNGHAGRDSFGISRRAILGAGLGAGLGLAAMLTGCTDTSQATATPGAGASLPPTLGPDSFKLPNTKLPSGPIKVSIVDSGDLKANYWSAMATAYQNKHPNVTVDYNGTNWNTIQQSITLGLQNGTAPDVFQLPGGVTIGQAIQNGWVMAFEDAVPDFQKIIKAYPAGASANGVTMFNGKTYLYSPSGNIRLQDGMLYNSKLVKDAGYDPSDTISWDDFRAMLKKITKNGAGQAYGIIAGLTQGNQLNFPVADMAKLAGAHFNYDGIDWKTGQYNYHDDKVVEAMELFLAIKSDGSFFPDSVSMDAPGARGRFPLGVAGVIMQGSWNIRPWQQSNPNFKFNIALPPRQDPKSKHMLSYGPGGSNYYVINGKTKSAKAVGDMIRFTMSKDGQTLWAQSDGSGDPAQYPGVFADAPLSPLETRAQKLAQDNLVITPEPAVRNPDINVVYQLRKAVTPNFSQVCVGLFTGQLQGVKTQFKKLSDASEKAREDAIAAAKKQGANVSSDDFMFSDFDPDKPYSKLYKKD
jgi:multiple sugar transport system substrate-binding protein